MKLIVGILLINFLHTKWVEIRFSFEKFESKECIRDPLSRRTKTKRQERCIYTNKSGIPIKSTLFYI